MNTVLIIPTGLGCELGGHAGDANPVANLIGSVSTNLILHPNVVNASSFNEQPKNTLYVEGSILDRFLEGKIGLNKVRKNKILFVANEPLRPETINAVTAGRVTLGADIEILILDTPLKMIASMNPKSGATGTVEGWKELVCQVGDYDFDALAISSPITIDEEVAKRYLRGKGGINPWGGVEALASKLIAGAINKPVAHAPMDTEENEYMKYFQEVVDPRMTSEMVSVSFMFCILKGLRTAPRVACRLVEADLTVDQVDVMVSPYGCVGRPHRACLKHNIPVIVVKENTCCLNNPIPKEFIIVENYLEAIGIIKAMSLGISIESLRRPFNCTRIINGG